MDELIRYWIPLVQFFDLITFFGVAAIFGWLGFASLHHSELKEIDAKKRERARRNLYVVNDYFLIAAIFFSLSACTDYGMHHPELLFPFTGPNPDLAHAFLGPVSVTFGCGILMLIAPVWAIRSIGRKGRDLGDIYPPPFRMVMGIAMVAVGNTLTWTTLFAGVVSVNIRILCILAAVVSYIVTYDWLKKWNVKSNRLINLIKFVLAESPIWLGVAVFLMEYGF